VPTPSPQPARTVRAALDRATSELTATGVPDARYDAEQLLAKALNEGMLLLRTQPERPLSVDEATRFDTLIRHRARREPLQHLLGNQPFRSLILKVTPATLIPRPETEELVDRALKVLETAPDAPRVLDLGTGTGCIALAIATEHPASRVTAVELSDTALGVAKANTDHYGLTGRVHLLHGDLYAPLPTADRFDLIISNPPYLTPGEWREAQPEVRDFEPRWALVGGEDGLSAYRRIFSGAPARLTEGGSVLVEIGWSQGEAVAAIARTAGFRQVDVFQDLAGRDRMVLATNLINGKG